MPPNDPPATDPVRFDPDVLVGGLLDALD